MANSAQIVATALELQQSGKLQEAESLYRQLLKTEPENPDAWHLLGMTLFAGNNFPAAIEALENAVALTPQPVVLTNMGVVLRAAGRLTEAKTQLERAVALDPKSVNSWNNLGTVCLELKELELAESHFHTTLSLDANFAQAAMNLGNLWQQQGRFQDAERTYRRLLKNQTNNPLLLNNLAEALRNQGKWEEAIELIENATNLEPNAVEPRLNLARCYALSGQTAQAQSVLTRLVEEFPGLAKPYHYLGKLQFEIGDMDSALNLIERAIEIDPPDPFAQSSLGFVHLEMGNKAEAEKCFRQVLALAPTMSEAHSCLLFLMSGKPEIEPQSLFDEHVQWGKMHSGLKPLKSKEEWAAECRTPITERRLRVGYVSPDFRHHAVASFIAPVLSAHDKQSVEVYCYAEVSVPDAMTIHLQSLADHWRFTTGLSDAQVAHQVMADKIDILVDLAGHTGNNRLCVFAYRPAPVQITWLGYPNTTGLNTIDYRLTCDIQDPIGEPTYHTEKLVRMKRGSFCFSEPKEAPAVPTLAANRNGFITFGSLHRPEKITEATLDLWTAVLNALPWSRISLFNTRFTTPSISKLLNAFEQRGIEADRIEIRNKISAQHYLEAYRDIDIALDVTPWAGGTTTLEALWMGIPVIAYSGDRRSARSTAAIVNNIGHPEWIAKSTDQFCRAAIGLASDLTELQNIRDSLRAEVRETLVAKTIFARELESTFRQLWREFCDNQ